MEMDEESSLFSNGMGSMFRVERQNQSISSTVSTRVLQTQVQNVRMSSNKVTTQGGFPVIMEMQSSTGGQLQDPSDLADLMRKKMEMRAQAFPSLSFDQSSAFSQFRNGGSGGEMVSSSSMDGMSRTQFAGSKSSSITASMSSSGGTEEIPESILEELRNRGLLKGNQKITATKTTISGSSSSSAAMGVTRSFSSSSGFPTSTSSGSLSGGGGEMVVANSPTVDLSLLPSPFRRAPFTFRNFEGPLWTDNITSMGMPLNLKDNRNTWDLSTDLKSKTKVSFSASQSQHAVFESCNGAFRAAAYQDQRVCLRQSYGASESESEEDEDDDDQRSFVVKRGIAFQTKPRLAYDNRLSIMDKPPYEPSEDDISSVGPSELDTLEILNEKDIGPVEHEGPKTPEHKRSFKVAQELLTTERSYVKILELIDQIFQFRVAQENRVQQMFPPETITQMFCNIKSLYQFHHDHLLPRLEMRLERWEDDPRIGDIMKESAPFLKMYSEYVQNFDNSINLINVYRVKNPRFAKIIEDIQAMEECTNLPITHHLIVPIQRIPRYRMLLEAYLKRLSEDSGDRKDTEQALLIVSKAAEHANEAMRRIDGFKKLLEAQEKIKGVMDLVSPTRMLLKEGKISKISARSSDNQERYLFLFSDMVLLCSIRNNYLRSGQQYQLRAKLEVGEMTISEGDDLEVLNTFYIQDDHKRIELYTEREDEKRAWMEAMYNARMDLMKRKSSLRLGSDSLSEDDLGVKEPAKIKSDSVSKCMECDGAFTIMKRRHHCHACGIVICAKCSNAKVPMQYANGKLSRVCEKCKIILQGKEAEKRRSLLSNPSSPDESPETVHGVLDVPASVPAVLNGYLNLRLRGKKEWTLRWFALRSDFVLYCYAKETDDRAMTATPIPGMNIQMAEELSKADIITLPATERDRTFRIAHGHGRKCFFFCAPCKDDALKWVEKLNLARNADLNNPNSIITDPSNNQP